MTEAKIGLSSLFRDNIINSDRVVWVRLAWVMTYCIDQPRSDSVVRARAGLKARAWAQALRAWASEI